MHFWRWSTYQVITSPSFRITHVPKSSYIELNIKSEAIEVNHHPETSELSLSLSLRNIGLLHQGYQRFMS